MPRKGHSEEQKSSVRILPAGAEGKRLHSSARFAGSCATACGVLRVCRRPCMCTAMAGES